MPHFLRFEIFEMPNFPHFQNKTEKESKMKFIDSGKFQSCNQMLSYDTIIFHMRFGAFHVTLGIQIYKKR